ncbi:MAG: hypothetical protein C4518_06865 [Desulfobacteraceae bacterium]|nr:MAG: hypothetical protein C4518_06865 [Desulfobacteraceae bacterium]
MMIKANSEPLRSWKAFENQIRSKGHCLLKRLDDFPNSILVTGCQRSGTTMVSRMIRRSEGVTDFQFGHDDELDAALILSGYVDHKPKGRYCFQTTYVNDNYDEYFSSQNGHKIIWVLRNPHSVVYSILHNWRRAALNRLFLSCGAKFLDEKEKQKVNRFGAWTVGRPRKACLAFNGKISQLFELKKHFGPDQLMVIDYDDLVQRKNKILPILYRFTDLPYNDHYTKMIHAESLNKTKGQSQKESAIVSNICQPVYLKARNLIDT